MRRAATVLCVWGWLGLLGTGLWAQVKAPSQTGRSEDVRRYSARTRQRDVPVPHGGVPLRQPLPTGWSEDVQRGFAHAQQQDVPVVLYVRDLFGQGYIDTRDTRFPPGNEYYPFFPWQMQRWRIRWRWQRYEQDLLGQFEVAQALAPFVRVQVPLSYQRLDDMDPRNQWFQKLLLAAGVLTEGDLTWRSRLVGIPYVYELHNPDGSYQHAPAVLLDDLLARERTALVVLTSDGQLLRRFPAEWLKSALEPGHGLFVCTGTLPGTTTWTVWTHYPWCGCYWHDPTPKGQDQPTVKELTEELEKLAVLCRTLAEGRRDVAAGRFEPAIATFRALIAGGDTVPEAIRRSARSEASGLEKRATDVLTEAEKLLALKAYRRAWERAAPLEGQGLANVSEAVSARFQALKQAVEANVQARAQHSPLRPSAGVSRAALSPEAEAQHWLVLGNNYLTNRMYAQAIEQYTKVIEKNPDTPAAAEARTKLEQARSLQAAAQRPAEGEPSPSP